ncbi:MAG: flagellin N-terminal helical domain-containing protein [Phycisphaerae bacterium]
MAFTTITNVDSLRAAHQLAFHTAALQTSLKRLSTGFRINTAADDPAGLMQSELLRAEEASTKSAIANAQRADNVLATADGALSEVSTLLVSLQSLVVSSANKGGLSSDEIDAEQLQVDSIISSINRITGTTTFDGIKPFSGGELGYITSAGPNAQTLQNLQIRTASVNAQPQTFSMQVVASAQHASLLYQGDTNGLNGPTTLTIAGNAGQSILSFASSTNAASIVQAVNELADSTGVTASATGNNITFLSTGYGSAQFVSVSSSNSNFQTRAAGAATIRAAGRDATITINGTVAATQGLSTIFNANGAQFSFDLATAANTNNATAQFSITGGGANFSITPQVSTAGIDSLGISIDGTQDIGSYTQSALTYSLADLATSGKASLKSGNSELAQKIVSAAINDISSRRAFIGAQRQYTLASTINSLNVALENLASSESAIRDTDFATETAELTRQQILVQTSESALVQANQNQNLILKLLGAQ